MHSTSNLAYDQISIMAAAEMSRSSPQQQEDDYAEKEDFQASDWSAEGPD